METLLQAHQVAQRSNKKSAVAFSNPATYSFRITSDQTDTLAEGLMRLINEGDPDAIKLFNIIGIQKAEQRTKTEQSHV